MPKKKATPQPDSRRERTPSTRADLEKTYKVSTMTGRVLLVRDSFGLSTTEKALMIALATYCGGPADNNVPSLTHVSENTMRDSASISTSSVKRALVSLTEKGVLRRKVRGGEAGTDWTIVDWEKVRGMSYRWTAMLARQSDEALSNDREDEAEAIPKATKPKSKTFKYEEDEILKSIIATPVAKNTQAPPSQVKIDADLKDFLVDHIPSAKTNGATYLVMREIPAYDECSATEYLKAHGLTACEVTVKDMRDDQDRYIDVLRVALPIHRYAALRLSHHCEREIPASSLLALTKKAGDVYSAVEYGIRTESWRSLLAAPETRSPAAMLISQFDAIAESWLAAGGYTYGPPVEAAEAVVDDEDDDDAPIDERGDDDTDMDEDYERWQE